MSIKKRVQISRNSQNLLSFGVHSTVGGKIIRREPFFILCRSKTLSSGRPFWHLSKKRFNLLPFFLFQFIFLRSGDTTTQYNCPIYSYRSDIKLNDFSFKTENRNHQTISENLDEDPFGSGQINLCT